MPVVRRLEYSASMITRMRQLRVELVLEAINSRVVTEIQQIQMDRGPIIKVHKSLAQTHPVLLLVLPPTSQVLTKPAPREANQGLNPAHSQAEVKAPKSMNDVIATPTIRTAQRKTALNRATNSITPVPTQIWASKSTMLPPT